MAGEAGTAGIVAIAGGTTAKTVAINVTTSAGNRTFVDEARPAAGYLRGRP